MPGSKRIDRTLLDLLSKSSLAAAHGLMMEAFAGGELSVDLPWACAQAASRFNSKTAAKKSKAAQANKKLLLRVFAAELAVVMLHRVKVEERVTQLLAALKKGPTTKDLPPSRAAGRYFAQFIVRLLCTTTPVGHFAIEQARAVAVAIHRLEEAPSMRNRLLVPVAVMAALGSDTADVAPEQMDIARNVVARAIKLSRCQPAPTLSDEAMPLAKRIVEVVFDKLEATAMDSNAACETMYPAAGAMWDWASRNPSATCEARARSNRNLAVAQALGLLCHSTGDGSASQQPLAALPTAVSGQSLAVVGGGKDAESVGAAISQYIMDGLLATPCPPSMQSLTDRIVLRFARPGLAAALTPEALPFVDDCFGQCVLSFVGAKQYGVQRRAALKDLTADQVRANIDPVVGTWVGDLVDIAADRSPSKAVAFKQAQAAAAALGITAGLAITQVDLRVSITHAALAAAPALRAAAASATAGATASAGATTAALRRILSRSRAFVVEPAGDFARFVGLMRTTEADGELAARFDQKPCKPLPAQGFSSLAHASDVGRGVAVLSCQLAAALAGEAVAPVVALSAVNKLFDSSISRDLLASECSGVFGIGDSEAEAMAAAGWVSTGNGTWRARTDTDEAPLSAQEKEEAAAAAAAAKAATTAEAAAKQAATDDRSTKAQAAAATADEAEGEEEFDAFDDDEERGDAGVFLALCPGGCAEFARRRLQVHAATTLAAVVQAFDSTGVTAADRVLALPELSFAAIAELVVSAAGPTALGLAVLGRGAVATLPDRAAASKLAAVSGLAESAAMQSLVTPATPDGFTISATGLSRKSSALAESSSAAQQMPKILEFLLGVTLEVPSLAGGGGSSDAAAAAAAAAAGLASHEAASGFASAASELSRMDTDTRAVQARAPPAGEDGHGVAGGLDGAIAAWTARPKLRVLKRLAPEAAGDSKLFLARPPALRLSGIAPVVAAAASLCAASTAADVDVGQVIVEMTAGDLESAAPSAGARRLLETCLDATAVMLMVPPAEPGSIGLRWTLASEGDQKRPAKAELFAMSRAKAESCAFVKGRLQKVSLNERATVAMATCVTADTKTAVAEPARLCSQSGACCPS